MRTPDASPRLCRSWGRDASRWRGRRLQVCGLTRAHHVSHGRLGAKEAGAGILRALRDGGPTTSDSRSAVASMVEICAGCNRAAAQGRGPERLGRGASVVESASLVGLVWGVDAGVARKRGCGRPNPPEGVLVHLGVLQPAAARGDAGWRRGRLGGWPAAPW
jgi:hypothetical protein